MSDGENRRREPKGTPIGGRYAKEFGGGLDATDLGDGEDWDTWYDDEDRDDDYRPDYDAWVDDHLSGDDDRIPDGSVPSSEGYRLGTNRRDGDTIDGKPTRGAVYSGADFEGEDLSGLDFTGAVFDHVRFCNVDLSGAKLDGARFDEAYFQDVDMSGASLDNAVFNRAYGTHVNMDRIHALGADLSFSHFESMDGLADANLMGADLTCAHFEFGDGHMDRTILRNAKMDDAEFLPSGDVVGADDADFSGAHGSNTTLQLAAGEDSKNLKFDDARFTDSYIDGVGFGTTFKGARFEHCTFCTTGLDTTGAELVDCKVESPFDDR